MRAREEFIMEKGTVKSFDKSCGMGIICRDSEADIKFYAESVVGRSRAGLMTGDTVWFEVDNIKNLHIAINVRKCV
jgi:cold shock CspA family protein